MSTINLKNMSRLHSRLNLIRETLELCETPDELYGTLQELGFHKYEYVSNEIYKDNDRKHPMTGVFKMHIEWTRVSEELGLHDRITEYGISVIDTTQPFTFASTGLTPRLARMLGTL